MKILILGNGFDLAHGLPTSYRDFFKFAEAALAIYDFDDGSKDVNTAIKNYSAKYLDSWKDERSTVQDIKKQLKELFRTREFKSIIIPSNLVISVNEHLDEFNKKLRNNVWYYYLNKLDDLKENWNNVEKEISDIIEILDKNNQDIYQDFSELSNAIYKSTETDTRKNRFKLFEESYRQRCDDTKRELSDVKRLIERLSNDLQGFIRAFEIYLDDFIEPIIPEIRRLPYFDTNRFDYVINFNYTHTYEKVYSIDTTRMCHIHGTCENSKKTNIVIGIGDYTKKERANFTIFKKTAQTFQNRNDMNYVFWQDSIEANEKLVDVYIYGHSLDVADQYVLESLLDSEYTKVHILYHNATAKKDLTTNLYKLIGDARVREKHSAKPSMMELKFLRADS